MALNSSAQYSAPPPTPLDMIGVDYFTNVTIAGTTLNSSNGGTNGGYVLVPSTPVTNTASLMQGFSYNFAAAVPEGQRDCF